MLRGMIGLYTKWRCFHGTIGKICPQPADHAPVCDEEFFPGYVKAHIDRGSKMLEQEQKYSSDFLMHLIELDQSL